MRTLNELYIILWDSIKNKERMSGICRYIAKIYISGSISDEEYLLLKNHFKSQKPNDNLHSEFLDGSTWVGSGVYYWWDLEEEVNPINRKAFIQKMIKITKPCE